MLICNKFKFFILVNIVIVINNGVFLLYGLRILWVCFIIVKLFDVWRLIIYIFKFVVECIVWVIVFGILWYFKFKNILNLCLWSCFIKFVLSVVNIFLFILRW